MEPHFDPDHRPAGARPRRESLRRAAAIAALPHPFHLIAAAAPGDHFHFGRFLDARDTLAGALDALTRVIKEQIALAVRPAGTRVLDVGCGLGGTSIALARNGATVVALDPEAATLAYAAVASAEVGAFLTFVARPFLDWTEAPPANFDVIVVVEALQYFPDLDALLSRCRELLVPGGRVVVADLALLPDLSWASAPFHRLGRLAMVAASRGFVVAHQSDLTAEVTPSPSHLRRLLRNERGRLVGRFADRGDVDAQIDELIAQCDVLDRALRNGDLRYQLTTLVASGSAP